MKIIHTSDIHIDSPLTSRLSADKVRERRAELRTGFGRLVNDAVAIGAEAIIIAGDLFDSEKVSRKALSSVLDTIERARGITFYYLEGNHEKSAIRNSGIALPENISFFDEDWTYFEAEDVCIVGRRTIASDMFDSLELSEKKVNIVVLHGELRDHTDDADAIGIIDANEKHISYMALGHYHSYSQKELPDGGVAVYSGTPEGRGFDETGEKGYVIIDTDGVRATHRFIPFAKRRLHTVPIDISGAIRTAELCDIAHSALTDISSNDLVRLELVGTYSPELIKDIDGLTRSLAERFYYFEVKDSSRPYINPDDYKYDKSLKGEFIRTVLADGALDDETKSKIISCGINALMGEELFGE